jgi:LacI family transcriptional regulator
MRRVPLAPRQRILIEVGLPYFQHTREIVRGILDYAGRFCPGWEFLTDPFDFYQAFKPGFFPPQKANGAFVLAYRKSASTETLHVQGIPAINLTLPDEELSLPYVTVDHAAIGRMAASHLDMPVIASTLYLGPESIRGRQRLAGFAEGLAASGRPAPHVLLETEEMRGGSAQRRRRHIAGALRKLRVQRPARLGVFGYSDSFAHAVVQVCKDLGLAVPHDVAVIGCDNDELVCGLSSIPLSSVPTNSRKVGATAAELLHRLMSGKRIPAVTRIDPLRPVERLSSSSLAVDDPVVAHALGIIREKAATGLRVYEMLDSLPVSRRSLETRFRRTLGRSPHEEIDRVRIEMAFGLLEADEMTNAKIALACGFSSATYFEQAFRRHAGRTPSFFRGKKYPISKPLSPPRKESKRRR